MVSLPSVPHPVASASLGSAPVGSAPMGSGLGLWQLGIEAQALTAQIAAFAAQLELEDPELVQSALG